MRKYLVISFLFSLVVISLTACQSVKPNADPSVGDLGKNWPQPATAHPSSSVATPNSIPTSADVCDVNDPSCHATLDQNSDAVTDSDMNIDNATNHAS